MTLCPDPICRRRMVPDGLRATCPRCGIQVVFPSPARVARNLLLRRDAALRAAQNSDVHQGFRDWLSNVAYWDGTGYRLKADRRHRAPWSAAVVALYPDMNDFAEAAGFFVHGAIARSA